MAGQDDNQDDRQDSGQDGAERPVSDHPNFVTADGLTLIELQLARGQEAYDAAQDAGDRAGLKRIERELGYWMNRRANAQVVAPPPDRTRVHFGSTVTLSRPGGGRETWRIVGEDEASPEHGSLPYVSPLAQALIGRRVGEVVQVEGGAFEVVGIS